MSTGWVYILSNPAIPRKVKVGWTRGRPEARARELHTTSVPAPFKVETALLFSDGADEIERRVHQLLSDKRVTVAREFFECDAQHALEMLLQAAKDLNKPVRDTDPILLSEQQIHIHQLQKAQELARLEEEKNISIQRQKQEEDERIKREQELAPARLEYFKAQWSYDSAARLFSTPNKPYPPFPSFEEWNSPHARSERQRIKEVKKNSRFLGKTTDEWNDFFNDR